MEFSENTYLINNLGDVRPKIMIGGYSKGVYPRTDMLFHNDEFFLGIECLDKNIKANPFKFDGKGRLCSGNQMWSVQNGKLKWDILLEQYRPIKIPFKVEQTKDISIFLQPELGEREVKAGCFRPVNIIDSIAIYCNKSGNDYRTGKLLHIERIFLIDSEGNTAFGEYELTDYGFDMVFPQEFLNKAKGNILVDPIFGYSSVGASSASAIGTAYGPRASLYNTLTASDNYTITEFALYLSSGTAGTCGVAAYSLSDGVPVTRLAAEETMTMAAAAGWNTLSVSQALVSGTSYCIAFGNGTQTRSFLYDSGTNMLNRYNTTGALPATWTAGIYYSYIVSVYATYTIDSGVSIPVIANNLRNQRIQ